jgi:hypothetical protein
MIGRHNPVGTLLLMGLACAPLYAQQNVPARVRQFAALPAWTGIWEGEIAAQLGSDEFDKAIAEARAHPEKVPTVAPPGVLDIVETFVLTRSPLHGKPPYNAEWDRKYELQRKKIQTTPASAVKPGSIKACGWEFPEIMDNPFDTLFQIFVTPEETLLLFPSGQARHIYTDRPHPKQGDLWPTDLGNSVGRWEGDTLVIDTIETKPGALVKIPFILSADFSDKVHYTERLRLSGPDAMQDVLTIEDPSRLAHPWTMTLKYRRVKDLDRLIPTNCTENDRFRIVGGKVTISSR